MNKENAKDYLPLVHALADGKIVQTKFNGLWHDYGEMAFSLPPEDYRIKPTPRTFVIYVNKHTHQICHQNRSDSNWERITVREVLE
jgi:hypothetical protein